jgi:hypothetical protein
LYHSMAKSIIEVTGRGGLVTRHQGDLNDSSAKPNLRYLAGEGQMADGIYNPFKKYGYMSPANNSIIPCTGATANEIKCVEYDPIGDVLYFGAGNQLLTTSALDDTSLSVDTTLSTGRDIIDSAYYEVRGKRALVYLTDSSVDGAGMTVGFKGLDDDSGIALFDYRVVETGTQSTYETIGNSDTNQKLAQRFLGNDSEVIFSNIDKVRVRITRLGVGTSYTIKVGIQRGSQSSPDGTYIASGTINPSDLSQRTAITVNGEDVYVQLDTSITLDSGTYWLVVEPTVLGDMTGTNSFVWYRTNSAGTLYSNGNTYAYDGSAWSLADELSTNETFDFSLLLSNTERWFPTQNNGLRDFFETSTLAFGHSLNNANHSVPFDSNHILVSWEGANNDGFVGLFTNGSDGATPAVRTRGDVGIGSLATGSVYRILTPGSVAHEFTTVGASNNTAGTWFVATGTDSGSGVATLLAVTEFDSIDGGDARIAMIDSTHFILTWVGGSAIEAQVFYVNTTTYEITAVGSPTTVAATGSSPNVLKVDSSTVAISYTDSANDGQIILYSVTGGFGLSAISSAFEFEDDNIFGRASLELLDSTHILVTWTGTDNDGFSRVITFSTTVGANTIVQDAATDGGVTGGGVTSRTISHTCAADANHLTVGVWVGTNISNITGVTYGGAAMTATKTLQYLSSGYGMAIYTLINPPSGTNNIVISSSISQLIAGHAVSHKGVYSSTTYVTADGGAIESSGTTDSVSITTAQTYSQVVGFGFGDNGSLASGANTTDIVQQATGDSISLFRPTTSPTPTASTVTLNQSNTGGWHGMIAVAFYGAITSMSFAGAEFEFNTSNATDIDSCIIDSTHFIISYKNISSNLVANTYLINGSYTISALGTELTIASKSGASDGNSIINIDKNIYVIAYTGVSNVGSIAALELNTTSYQLTQVSVNDTFTVSPNIATGVEIVRVSDTKVAVVYKNDGVLGSIDFLEMLLVIDSNSTYIQEGQSSFIRKSDNGLLYWFVDNTVHSVDGSITGNNTGLISRNILQFPSYMSCADAVDKAGYLYVAIHSSKNDTSNRLFSTNAAGVYIWDRQSTVVRTRDYYSIEGVREIKKIFLSKRGDVMLIDIANSGACELRKLVNGAFVVVQRLEKDGYPKYHSSVAHTDDMTTWMGANGIMYGYGSIELGNPEGLFKIGSIASKASGTFSSGTIYTGGTTNFATYLTWIDDTTNKVSKWYPNGEGTISSVVQIPHSGSVYTPVQLLPSLSTVNYIHLYSLPITTSDTTVMGTLKIYFNQSTTPWASKVITKADLVKGAHFISIGKQYVNSVQFEIEWDTANAIGTDTWTPMTIELDYTPTPTISR